LLDEVDAPLDDASLNATQISHQHEQGNPVPVHQSNKIAMEMAEQLVTMQEQGVSASLDMEAAFGALWRRPDGTDVAPMKNETRRHHGAPYKLLAVAGGLILTGVVAHSAWSPAATR
jgi:hypothetical protein